MSLGSGWRRLLRRSLGQRALERDVSDELAFHFAMREEKLRRVGLAPEAAHEQARRRFGDPDKVLDVVLFSGDPGREERPAAGVAFGLMLSSRALSLASLRIRAGSARDLLL